MNTISGVTRRNITLIVLAIIAIFLLAGIFYATGILNKQVTAEPDPSASIALLSQDMIEYAEDLNDVLPQRQGLNTTFDSVAIAPEKMFYYYSVQNLTLDDVSVPSVRDSLYTEAENRIPCTLWRPLFMQGVEVTFTYYSSDDGSKLLQFSRDQDECHER